MPFGYAFFGLMLFFSLMLCFLVLCFLALRLARILKFILTQFIDISIYRYFA